MTCYDSKAQLALASPGIAPAYAGLACTVAARFSEAAHCLKAVTGFPADHSYRLALDNWWVQLPFIATIKWFAGSQLIR